MSDVPHATAIALVHDGLRDDVLPAVAEDRHASSALKAALGILRNVASELEAGDAWCAPMLADALPLAAAWPAVLRAPAPQAADEVRRLLEQASAHAGDDPLGARTYLLRAAERTIAEAWRHDGLRQGTLLTDARRVVRADLDAQIALAR